eukprot:g26849.t1
MDVAILQWRVGRRLRLGAGVTNQRVKYAVATNGNRVRLSDVPQFGRGVVSIVRVQLTNQKEDGVDRRPFSPIEVAVGGFQTLNGPGARRRRPLVLVAPEEAGAGAGRRQLSLRGRRRLPLVEAGPVSRGDAVAMETVGDWEGGERSRRGRRQTRADGRAKVGSGSRDTQPQDDSQLPNMNLAPLGVSGCQEKLKLSLRPWEAMHHLG